MAQVLTEGRETEAGSSARAQKEAQSFAVVSIRESKPGGELSFGTTPTGYESKSTPLMWVVMAAELDLPLADWRAERVVQSPDWVRRDPYDIQAKVDTEVSSRFAGLSEIDRDRAIKPLLHSMLKERCHLKVHIEETNSKVLALVRGASSIRIKQTLPGEEVLKGIALPNGAVMRPGRKEGRLYMQFYNTSMKELAEVLSGFGAGSQPIIVDRTELTGKYAFTLYKRELDQDESQAKAPDPLSSWNVGELGLTLKSTSVPLPVVVIDHIERPTPN